MEQWGYNLKNENMHCFRVYLHSYIFETMATIREWKEIPIFHDHVGPCKHLTLGPSCFLGESVHLPVTHPDQVGGESHGSMTISDPFILDPQVIRTSWLVATSAIPDWETWTSWNGWLEQKRFHETGEKVITTLFEKNTLLVTNISHQKSLLKMIFLFPRWDMLVPWRVMWCLQ